MLRGVPFYEEDTINQVSCWWISALFPIFVYYDKSCYLIKKLPTVCQGSYNILHSHGNIWKPPLFHILSYSWYFKLFNFSYLKDIQWYQVILICFVWWTNNVEDLFISLLTICINAWVKSLFRFLLYYTGLHAYLLLSSRNSLYIFNASLFSNV